MKKSKNCYAKVFSWTILGVKGVPIEVECHQSQQLPSFTIVGLCASDARDSRERIHSALQASGYALPSRRILVNLAPANVQKFGSSFDLPIAISCLVASGAISEEKVRGKAFLGELTLSGDLKPAPAAFALPELLRSGIFRTAMIPLANSRSFHDCKRMDGGGFRDLRAVVQALLSGAGGEMEALPDRRVESSDAQEISMEEILGQYTAKQMLLLAAAGEHSALLVGPRGSGKSFLASAYRGILPNLNADEIEQITAIHGARGINWDHRRPFRAPHHSITAASLMGGGIRCVPGEVSMAHGGILFLDELLEIKRPVLESLRISLEQGEVHLSRAGNEAVLPARVYFLGATNLCPCGKAGSTRLECRCSESSRSFYRNRLSYAMRDRLDLSLTMEPELSHPSSHGEISEFSTKKMQALATRARSRMLERQGIPNGRLIGNRAFQVIPWERGALTEAQKICQSQAFSERGFRSLARIALTVADLQESPRITKAHIWEASHFRYDQLAVANTGKL